MRLVTFEIDGRVRLGAEWGHSVLDLQNAHVLRAQQSVDQ